MFNLVGIEWSIFRHCQPRQLSPCPEDNIGQPQDDSDTTCCLGWPVVHPLLFCKFRLGIHSRPCPFHTWLEGTIGRASCRERGWLAGRAASTEVKRTIRAY